jgi:hypothetical protein
METLWRECECKSMVNAWAYSSISDEFYLFFCCLTYINWPLASGDSNSISIVICQHDFSKQNWVSGQQNLKTLGALKRVCLYVKRRCKLMDWHNIFDVWSDMKTWKMIEMNIDFVLIFEVFIIIGGVFLGRAIISPGQK